jgi:hypothetical protein
MVLNGVSNEQHGLKSKDRLEKIKQQDVGFAIPHMKKIN